LTAQYPSPAPVQTYEYFNDFSTYNSGDWTVTTTNGGTSALTDGEGGLLIQTTGATSTNYQANQLKNLSWYVTTGYRHWFGINFKLSDTAHTAFQAGWIDTLAGPLTPGSGIYFSKTDASTTLNLIINNASATTTIAVGTIAASTAYSVGWYFNAAANPTLYIYSSIGLTLPYTWEGQQQFQYGVRVASVGAGSNTNPTLLTNLPAATVGHTMGWGLSTGTNAAHTLTVDHVFSGSAVNRF
jgi:hypothetical protein